MRPQQRAALLLAHGWAAVTLAAGQVKTDWSAAMPAVRVARCEAVAGGLQVEWDSHPEADYYELQLAEGPDAPTFAALSTARNTSLIADVLPGRDYWLRIRAHRARTPSLGPGTWGPTAAARRCRSANDGRAASASRVATPSRPKGNPAETLFLEMMRQSEYTYDIDYLMNHNAGDVVGDTAFLTYVLGLQNGSSANGSSFLNVSFQNATFSLFCVEVLRVSVPNTTTTLGNSSFSDFLSCNDNGNATDPRCGCDNWIDRGLGGLDPNKSCATRSGAPCSWQLADEPECHCNCSQESLDLSSRYVGMMPVTFAPSSASTERYGRWYSLPAGAECKEDEPVGTWRAAAERRCTWRRRPALRVVHGWDVLKRGFRTDLGGKAVPSRQLVLQNAAAFWKAFGAAPLAEWRCGGPQGAEVEAELVV